MKNAIKTVFGMIASAALALTPMQAFAEEAADANTPVATAPVTAVAAQSVQYVDATGETMNGARRFAAAASNDKIAIVVWGGNRAIQQEAYNAARDLAGIGIPTAFVLAPDHNDLDGDAVMQVYAASTPRSDSHWGRNYADQVRADMRDAGLAAYREAFPQRISALSLN